MNYLEKNLEGYANHRDYLTSFFYSECLEAEKAGIEHSEFFERLGIAVKDVERYWLVQYMTMSERCTLDKETFSTPLAHYTRQLGIMAHWHIGLNISQGMIEYIRKGIADAFEKRVAETQVTDEKHAQDILREYHYKEGELSTERVKELAIQHGKSAGAWTRKYNNEPDKWRDKFKDELRKKQSNKK